ncbi:MAG: hypothetical protein ACTSQJ_06035 [Promethearchaeota archaeon]
MSKINWNDIAESNILILKENETVQVKFLDNGIVDTASIIDKKTNQTKEIKKYVFKIVDLADNKEKELSTLATRLMIQLKPFNPLKDKSLYINKFRTGVDVFDVDFRVSEIQ